MTGQDLIAAYAAGERDFRGANLAFAYLAGANLTGADLTDADLTGANLTGATYPTAPVVPDLEARTARADILARGGAK